MSKTYPYVKHNSILYGLTDEYSLSKEEYYLLYSFFVTYSMCGTQSAKKKSFTDYGWNSNKIEDTSSGKAVPTALGKSLKTVLEFKRLDSSFVFSSNNDLGQLFLNNQLSDGILPEYDTERFVIGNTTGENKYTKLFYRIRDGFAHGKYILKYSSRNEKMILFQDNDRTKVTARILLKLNTLLSFATVSSNGML